MKRSPSVGVTALLILLSACGGNELGGGDPLEDGGWRLVAGSVDSVDLVLVEHRPVTLVLTGESAGGTAACNMYGATLRREGGRLSFDGLHYTAMACLEEGVMDLEAAYLDALSRVDTVRLGDDELVLSGPGVTLRFAVLTPQPDEALVGTEWALDTLVDDEVARTPAARASIRFESDGIVTGNTGCNGFGGRYDAETGFSELVQTLIGCPGAVGDQEAHFMEVLEGATEVSVGGPLLTITAPDGRGLVFRAAS